MCFSQREYWGTKKEHPWMGYCLEPIEFKGLPFEAPHSSSTLYKIAGVNTNENVVGHDVKESTLTNKTYLFVCKMMGKTRGGYVSYLKPEFIKEPWDWCKNH